MELCQAYREMMKTPGLLEAALKDLSALLNKKNDHQQMPISLNMASYRQAVSSPNTRFGGADAPYMQMMLEDMDRMVDLGPIIIDGSINANDNN